MNSSFKDFSLPDNIQEALQRIKLETPTPIQVKAIPVALLGKDIIGSAPTGTGKTAAFMLPLLNYLAENPTQSSLVLAPTREIAMQILNFIHKLFGRRSRPLSALLIGGDAIGKQLRDLKYKPRLIVGTPGRVNDHLERGSLKLDKTTFLVLDEMDSMLDYGFKDQMHKIVAHLPKKRQTLMFSATFHKDLEKISLEYLTDPERISVGSVHAPALNIKQETLQTTKATKYNDLLKELDKREGSIIIFVKTRRDAENLSKKLNPSYSADYLHGDLKQSQRTRRLQDFSKKKFKILVATDVAARGIDTDVGHVINYDLPQCPENYIHRIGRTARAGSSGASLCLISPEDKKLWKAIQNLINDKADQPRVKFSSKPKRKVKFSKNSHKSSYRGQSKDFYKSSNKNSNKGFRSKKAS